jgi:hypothetical protein
VTLQDERPRTRLLLPDAPPAAHRHDGPRRRSTIVAGVVVCAVMALGVASEWLGGSHRRGTTAPPAAQPEPQGAVPAPAAGSAYPNSRDGAQSAAANYVVQLGGAEMFDTERRRDVVRRIADPAVEPALQQQFDTAFAAVLSNFGLDDRGRPPRGLTLVSRALPVGVRIVDYSDSSARVAVWTTGIIGLAGATSTRPVAEAWSTTTVTLRWTGSDWKWVSFTQQDGPTPISGLQPPSSAREVADAVATFGELHYAR